MSAPASDPLWYRRSVWYARHRVAVVAIALAGVAVLAAGLGRVRIDDDYRAFIDHDDPDLVALERFERVFSRTEQVLLAYAPADGDVFSRGALDALGDLTRRAWSLPWAVRVDSMANFQHTRAVGDTLIVEPLVGRKGARLPPTEVREKALAEPALRSRLVAPDGHVAAVSVRLDFGEERAGRAERATAAARSLARAFEHEHPGAKIYVTGNVPLDAAFPEATVHDVHGLLPLMILVVALTMAVMLRSVAATVITVAVVAMAAAAALGAAGWMGMPLTAATASAPTIIMTLAVADCVHLLSTYLAVGERGADPLDALAQALAGNFSAVGLTSLTTTIGFLSLNVSDSPALRDLGSVTAVGVVVAWALAVTLVPALLTGQSVRRFGNGRRPRSGERWPARFVDAVLARRRAVLAGAALLAGLAAAALPRIEINDRFVEYFDRAVPFRSDTEFVSEHLSGIYRIHYSLPAGAADGVYEPAYLKRADRFVHWLRRQPEVVHVDAITDLMRRLSRSMHGDDPRWYRLPESRAEAAQYLLAYQMSVPYGLDPNDSVSIDASSTRITVTLDNPDNAALQDLARRADGWLAAHTPPSMHASAVGSPLIFARLAARNIGSMLRGSVLALVLIAVVLAVALRDVGLALLSLVPNVLPALLGFGVWSVLVGEVGLALSVVTAMTLGIVVDDTVHLLERYLAARRDAGLDAATAVRRAVTEVGDAVVATSVVLVLGFAVLATSSYAIHQGLGRLSALIVAIALAADLTVLPALLVVVYGDGRRSQQVSERSRRLR